MMGSLETGDNEKIPTNLISCTVALLYLYEGNITGCMRAIRLSSEVRERGDM